MKKKKYRAFISYKHSEKSRRKALALEKELKNYQGDFGYLILGIYYRDKEDLDKAIHYFEKGLKACKDEGVRKSTIRDQLGKWMKEKEKLDKSKDEKNGKT